MKRRTFAFDSRTVSTAITCGFAALGLSLISAHQVARANADALVVYPDNIPETKPQPSGTVRQGGAFGVNLEAWALMPMGLGGGLSIEGPGGVRAGVGFGVTPTAFITLAQESIRQPGSYATEAADAIVQNLEDPFFGRVSLAFVPPSLGGFYFGVGYGFLRAGVSVTAGDVPRDLWPTVAGVNKDTTATLTLTLHQATADIGWEFSLGDNWHLRATVGGVFTFAANASLRVSGLAKVVGLEEQEVALDKAQDVIEETVVSYGSIPTVTLTVSYRIF